MTEPLTPPECDLRGMPFMPIEVVRLFDSDVYALSTGDEFKAAFTLWGKAFLQVPAGSLPNDDRILAHLSGAGARWAKVRDMALRGWVECSDGRLYHPVVAEKAREAWQARLAQRARTEAARASRAAKRQGCDSSNTPPATEAVTGNVTAAATETVTTSVTDNVTGSKGQLSKVREERKSSETSSRAAEASPSPAAMPPPDARTVLWTEGLGRLRRLTGKPDRPARALLGQLCRAAGDDCALVSGLLHEAEAGRYGDPLPWLQAAIRTRTGEREPQRKPTALSQWADLMAPSATAFDFDGQAEETAH